MLKASVAPSAAGCSSGSELLLLLRSSKHNNNTWGLPGGNVEPEDTDLLVTAKREAREEMGSVPEAAFLTQILTKYVQCAYHSMGQGKSTTHSDAKLAVSS